MLGFLNQPFSFGRRRIGPEPRQGIGVGNEPAQLVGRRQAQGILQHRFAQVATRAHGTNQPVGAFAQIIVQHGPQIFNANAAIGQFLPITVFRQVRLTAEHPRSGLDAVVERKVFERMQGIVMNEDVDRPLGRQEVRRVLDHPVQMILAPSRIAIGAGSA